MALELTLHRLTGLQQLMKAFLGVGLDRVKLGFRAEDP